MIVRSLVAMRLSVSVCRKRTAPNIKTEVLYFQVFHASHFPRIRNTLQTIGKLRSLLAVCLHCTSDVESFMTPWQEQHTSTAVPLRYHTKGNRDQLNVIFNVLGTPSSADIDQLEKEDARRYVRIFQAREPTDLGKRFPASSGKALSTLSSSQSNLVLREFARPTQAHACFQPNETNLC